MLLSFEVLLSTLNTPSTRGSLPCPSATKEIEADLKSKVHSAVETWSVGTI